MSSSANYEEQFLQNFELLIGKQQGLLQRDFTEILQQVPNPPSLDRIDAAFKRHSDNGKHIDCDCMLEAAAELTDSSNARLITMTLVQTIERMQWKKLFTLVDEDNSGRVDIQELKSFVDALATVMPLTGYNNQDAAKWMRELGQSEIDFESFITVARRLTRGVPVITVADKVEEAKRAVRERKATALNLFQTRVLTSMLRKRGATMKATKPGDVFVDPLAETMTADDSPRGNSPDASNNNNNNRNGNVSFAAAALRGTSPASGTSALEFEVQQFLKPQCPIVAPTDVHSTGAELSRLLSSEPIRDGGVNPVSSSSSNSTSPAGYVTLEQSHQASLGRVASVTHCHDSARILSLLDQHCKQENRQQFDASRTAKHVSDMCSKIADAVNGPPGTLFEMQRAAVSRAMELANEFLTKISAVLSGAKSPQVGAMRGSGGIVIPGLKLDSGNLGSHNNNNNNPFAIGGGAGGVGRERTISTMSAGSGQRSRAKTIMESNFGREQLYEIAQDKLEQIEDARRDVGSAQEDIDYAINQIILPRNKIVEYAMSLLPHSRSSTALAASIRRFELQTQELYDNLAYYRFFADMNPAGKIQVRFEDDDNSGGAALSSSPEAKKITPKLSICEMMKIVRDERWGDSAPERQSEKFQELMAESTVHVAFVTEGLFRHISSPTAWIKELADVAADLAVQVKSLQSSFLRDRAVQTSTELLISLQSFPVNFSLKSSARDASTNSRATGSDADAEKNEASLREKRRLLLAQNRIRRSLVSDITRAAESVDLLIKRYLSAGVIVPANFGRVISTDPAKQKRHTFRFGSRLIDITPMDDRLAVHSSGGYMYFDEFCMKFSEIETKRMQRDEKRNPTLNASINAIYLSQSAAKNATSSGSSKRSGSNGDHRSVSSMSNNNNFYNNNNHYSTGSNNNARSVSALTSASSNNNQQTTGSAIVEFTVRSGSPVQVVPFPGLAEANARSLGVLAQQEITNSTRGYKSDNQTGNNNVSTMGGMIPAKQSLVSSPGNNNNNFSTSSSRDRTSPSKRVGFQ